MALLCLPSFSYSSLSNFSEVLVLIWFQNCWFSQEALSKNLGICLTVLAAQTIAERMQSSPPVPWQHPISRVCSPPVTVPGTRRTDRNCWGNSCFLGRDLWSCMISGKSRLAPGGGKCSSSFSLILHRSQKFSTSVRASVCAFWFLCQAKHKSEALWQAWDQSRPKYLKLHEMLKN